MNEDLVVSVVHPLMNWNLWSMTEIAKHCSALFRLHWIVTFFVVAIDYKLSVWLCILYIKLNCTWDTLRALGL